MSDVYIIVLGFVVLLVFWSHGGAHGANKLTTYAQSFRYGIVERLYSILPSGNDAVLTPAQQRFLFDQLRFYKWLSPIHRKRFNARTARFLAQKTFVSRQGFALSADMKLLISAVAVKLTFGLRNYLLSQFSQIAVYPKAYFNPLVNQYHKGEVRTDGIIILNWEDFYQGISIPDDDLNLGLHEFAHALALQRIQNPVFIDDFFKQAFDKLMRHANNKVIRSKFQQRLGLRTYALANPMEFFAVTTEAFFENPVDMYRANPKFYQLFAEMYNLDLLKLSSKPVVPFAH